MSCHDNVNGSSCNLLSGSPLLRIKNLHTVPTDLVPAHLQRKLTHVQDEWWRRYLAQQAEGRKRILDLHLFGTTTCDEV